MNIEEAKLGQTVYVKGIITDIDKEEIFDLEIHTSENDFFVNSEDVFLKLDQPKTVVKECVAEWYEDNKVDFYLNLHKLAWGLIANSDEDYFVPEKVLDSDFKRWYYRNKTAIQTLINMHQFGYTVEKEKLYTVDLPNGQPLVRGKNTLYFSQNLAAENARLTESEIRKDFDWAWQWAEKV
ncbi:DUF1642 domain-containing protein [Streptococcus halichoeri]|uniref:DUF1642 domain-containing protein n=1 Tax=Streptococcus halichoeri TaxID=254785 RepID=UPI001359CCA8|nr:DUF1642 domain-containing protein [Streptococcus halichoeri]